MEFVSGQKLTAQNLNNLVSLAEGQNIPTDGQFIKSKGVNMWTPPRALPEVVKTNKIFDVQVRYHDINDAGQEKSEDYEANYKPFWYVYLGSDSLNGDIWDLQIEAGSGTSMLHPSRIYTQPLPSPNSGITLDYFKFKNSITQMVHYTEPTTDELKKYQKFYAKIMLDGKAQTIDSDLNGWYCTGLPAYEVEVNEGEGVDEKVYRLDTSSLYATFMRINTVEEGANRDAYATVLIFSNQPIVGLGNLKINDKYEVTLPDGITIQYAEIMGGHSRKIASYKYTYNYKYFNIENLYGIDTTSLIPDDDIRKSEEGWDIVVPTIPDDTDEKAKKQLHNYEFASASFIQYDGLTVPFYGNKYEDNSFGDDKEQSYEENGTPWKTRQIYFSDLLNSTEKPDADVCVYYIDLVYDKNKKYDEYNPKLKIYKIPGISGSMTEVRALISDIHGYAEVQLAIKSALKPSVSHTLIGAFILNTNGKINPDENELIPWSIEYVCYYNRLPDVRRPESEDDIRFKLRASIESEESVDSKTQYRPIVEYYQGFFFGNIDTETGVRWNHIQFDDVTPNPVPGWHPIYEGEWSGNEPSVDVDVYLNLTASYMPSPGKPGEFSGQFEVSLNPIEQRRTSEDELGSSSLCCCYNIGHVNFGDGNISIKQNIIGQQNFVELFDESAMKAAAGVIIENIFDEKLPKPDAQVPVCNLSSIDLATASNGKDEINIYEIYQFHNLDNQVKLDDNRKANSDIIIRTRSNSNDKKPAIVEYLPLQELSAMLSSGQTYGYTGDIDNVTSVYWDANDFKIKAVGVTMSYENGLLKTVSEQKNLGTVDTVGFELSQE